MIVDSPPETPDSRYSVNCDLTEIEFCLITAIRTGEKPCPPFDSPDAQHMAAMEGIPESSMAAEDAAWHRDWSALCLSILAILPFSLPAGCLTP